MRHPYGHYATSSDKVDFTKTAKISSSMKSGWDTLLLVHCMYILSMGIGADYVGAWGLGGSSYPWVMLRGPQPPPPKISKQAVKVTFSSFMKFKN